MKVNHAGLPRVRGIAEGTALQITPEIERAVELAAQVAIPQTPLPAVRVRVPPEQMIEGPFLEHQHDDVIERRASARTE